MRVCESRRFSARITAIAVAGVVWLAALDAADIATGGPSAPTVTIRVAVVYSGVGVWRGTFVTALPTEGQRHRCRTRRRLERFRAHERCAHAVSEPVDREAVKNTPQRVGG